MHALAAAEFGEDTVREILCNAGYAGYVSGLRDKTREIKGLHEAIVSDELFDRVQEVRSWRTTVVKPGQPSEDYLLCKLLCCEHCGARMHGTRGSRAGARRYQCSTHRHHGDCEQTIVHAEYTASSYGSEAWSAVAQVGRFLKFSVAPGFSIETATARSRVGRLAWVAATGEVAEQRTYWFLRDLSR